MGGIILGWRQGSAESLRETMEPLIAAWQSNLKALHPSECNLLLFEQRSGWGGIIPSFAGARQHGFAGILCR
ncbi:MAG: hypothetical protein ORN23_09665 [Chthoniobacterales bacterium]|nr:hypothetical protein [Chthoniobacterales bacterium]